MTASREEMAALIHARLVEVESQARERYEQSSARIGYFVVDHLLPDAIAHELFSVFPERPSMSLKKSLRENKFVSAQMDRHASVLEECIYAFQAPSVVSVIGRICGSSELQPDEHLYAGGLSRMEPGQYLNPHLDNSHDKDRARWRVLNLLYYVTPQWPEDVGGNLEIWPDGLEGAPIELHSRFNRLIVMATHQASWHSVNPIAGGAAARCCISNYYFSESPVRQTDEFHVTSFRGRPEQPLRDAVLKADIAIRSLVRKVFRKGIVENPHVYKR